MLIIKDKETISKHLDIVEKALPGKTTLPILNNIFVEKNNDDLTFLSTNLEIGVRSSLKLESDELSEEESSIEQVLIPAKIIPIIKHLPSNKKVEINIDKDSYSVGIKGGESQFQLKGINAEEYPVFKEEEPQKKPLILKERDLKETIRRTVFATSSDEGRPAFTGVLVLMENNKLSFIASDTYRLVMQNIEIEKWEYEEEKFLIPARSLRDLMKLLRDSEEEVYIYPIEKQLVFSFNHIFFYTRLLEDNFPDFRKIIPTSHLSRIIVDKENFEEIISRASLLSDNISKVVKLQLKENVLYVSATSEIGKMEENITLEAKEGDDIDILLNVRFLMDVLKVVETQNIEIKFNGREAPTILRPEKEEEFLYLVLPIKVEQPL